MVIETYWYPEYDINLDFWNVMYDNGGIMYQVLACDSQEIANHVSDMHNRWYQNEAYDTYVDNITLSAINVILQDMVDDLEGDAEQQDYWRSKMLTDVSQLPDAPYDLAF